MDTSIAALLNAVQRGKGYTISVSSIKQIHGIVYINVSEPYRTVTVTEKTYDKLKDYLVIEGYRQSKH